MIKIAICDNDKNDREHLRKLLLEFEVITKENFLIKIFGFNQKIIGV